MKRLDIVINILTDVLGVEHDEVTPDSDLKALGADSFDNVELIMSFEDELDIELTDEECDIFLKSTVKEMLAKLDEWLGPEKPVDGLLTLTDDQFIRRYEPELNSEGGYFRQREWFVKADVPHLRRAVDAERCWTAVEDDNGDLCFVWGNRVVNRIYNIITRRPIENSSWDVQVVDDVELNGLEVE